MMKTSEEFAMLTPADHVPGPQQGEWTYDSYAALPKNGIRYEIINGVLYMVPAPNDFHQEIVALLISYLIPYIKHAGRGRVLGAPIDVVLEPGTVVQSDVLVLLERKEYYSLGIFGGEQVIPSLIIPDLAIPTLRFFG